MRYEAKMGVDDEPSSLAVSIGNVTVSAAPRGVAAGAGPDWSFSGKLTVEVDGRPVVVRVDLNVVVARPRDGGADTFLGAPHAAHIERLVREPVAAVTMNKGGTGLSFRLELEKRSRCLYKPAQTNAWSSPRKEVAAYRIARALGMNGVPPCTMRSLHRDDLVGKLVPHLAFLAPRVERETVFDARGHTHGSAAVWVPDLVDSHLDTLAGQRRWKDWLTVGNAVPEEDIGLAAQVSSMVVLDRLTDNFDRFTGGGVLSSRDGETLYLLDNSIGFGTEPRGNARCAGYLARCQKFRRSVVEALRGLDAGALDRALEDDHELLTSSEKRVFLLRAALVLEHVDGLLAARRTRDVLVFD